MIVQRWCSHSAYSIGGAGAEEVMQSDYVEVMCRGGADAEVVQMQRWCEEVVQRWCKGDAEGGAEKVQRQRSRGSKVLRF